LFWWVVWLWQSTIASKKKWEIIWWACTIFIWKPMVDDNRHKQNVDDAIDDMEVDVNTLARFKRHLQEEDSVENRNKVERYLVDGYE